MNFKGILVSGTGKGTYFMSQKIYQDQIKENLGFTPFEGTLNIQIKKYDVEKIGKIPEDELGIIRGEKGFGDVKFIEAKLNNEINGAILFPLKTHHKKNILEFIAPKNLRKSLKIQDGDFLTLNIDAEML
jgi:riboflavin kinase, archaea type